MNIQISPQMMKWQKEIEEAFGGPMFFIFDDQLVNLYSYLGRLSDNELVEFCKDEKFAKMCSLVTSERKSDFGPLSEFANERGMLNIEGLMPILASFPTFNDAMNFIMRIKPGFRYTEEFKDFVEGNIVIENTSDYSYNITTYTLGNYQYIRKYSINNDDYIVEYRKLIDGEWLLHRVNGPASINLSYINREILTLEWYVEGNLYLDNNEYNRVVYHGEEGIYDYEEYTNNESNFIELPYNITKINDINAPDFERINYYNNDYNFAFEERSYTANTLTTNKFIHDALLDKFRLVEKYVVVRGKSETITRYYMDGNISRVENNSMKPPFKTKIVHYNPDGTIMYKSTF